MQWMRLVARRLALAWLMMRYRLAEARGSAGIEVVNERLLRTRGLDRVLRHFGARIPGPITLLGPLIVHNADRNYRNLTIGENAHIGRLVLVDLADQVIIGEDATVAMGATILTHQDIGDRPLAARYPRKTASTVIGAGAYIGANATILCGCSIGERAVVGAGAVVIAPVEAETVAVGVPARPVRDLAPDLEQASAHRRVSAR